MFYRLKLNSPLLVCSVPKCGTHLLLGILRSILGKELIIPSDYNDIRFMMTRLDSYLLQNMKLEKKIYVAHLGFSEEINNLLANVPKILLIRDPRDYVVSQTHFMDTFKIKENTVDVLFRNFRSKEEKIAAVILGVRTHDGILPSVYDIFNNYHFKWLNSNCFSIRYEDLARAKDGFDKVSLNAIRAMLNFMRIEINDNEIMDFIYTGADPAKSATFRTGTTGSWRKEFTPLHVELMKIAAPKLISSLGYEPNEDWSIEHVEKHSSDSDTEDFSKLQSIDQIEERYLRIKDLCRGMRDFDYIIDTWALMNFVNTGLYEQSIPLFDKLLKVTPENGEMHYLKAFCLQSLNQKLDVALKHYDLALINKFSEFWIKYNRGLLFASLGKTQLAVKDLKDAIVLNPSHTDAANALRRIQE